MRSNTTDLTSDRPAYRAAARPAGPAPMIRMSVARSLIIHLHIPHRVYVSVYRKSAEPQPSVPTPHLDALQAQQEQPFFPPLSLIHISEPTRLGMISYAVFCLKKKKKTNKTTTPKI